VAAPACCTLTLPRPLPDYTRWGRRAEICLKVVARGACLWAGGGWGRVREARGRVREAGVLTLVLRLGRGWLEVRVVNESTLVHLQHK
jgi:hypothetical protein